MLQLLIKVPEETTLDKLPEDLLNRINAVKGRRTDDLLWNTRVYLGDKLINFVCEGVTVEDIQGVIGEFELSWTILAANDGTKKIETEDGIGVVTNTLIGYDPKVIINFINRKKIYEDGELVKETEPEIIEFGRFGGEPILEPMEVI